jgi:hypothetical protein
MLIRKRVKMLFFKFIRIPFSLSQSHWICINVSDCFLIYTINFYHYLCGNILITLKIMKSFQIFLINFIIKNAFNSISLRFDDSRINFIFYSFSRIIMKKSRLRFVIFGFDDIEHNLFKH